jgi:hypothetical protein
MDTYKKGQKLIQALEESLGQGPIALDDDGAAEIEVAGWPTLFQLVEETEELILHTPLGVLPTDHRRPELVKDLMKANYAGVGTAGGTIGKDPDSDLMYLSHRFAFFTPPPDFIEKLDHVLGFAFYWRDKLQERPMEQAWVQSAHLLRV